MVIALIFFLLLMISLFILFVLSENDFILIRRNITLPFMFNHVFIAIIIGVFMGRLFIILDSRDLFFANPLVFFHFLKYNGFSLLGGFLGIILSTIYFIKDRKALGRVLDIISLSFFPFLILYLFYNPFLSQQIILRILIFVVLILLFKTFISSHKNYSLKDSSLFLVVLITFSHFNILYNLYNFHNVIFMRFAFSDLISMFVIVLSVLLLIKNERRFIFRK